MTISIPDSLPWEQDERQLLGTSRDGESSVVADFSYLEYAAYAVHAANFYPELLKAAQNGLNDHTFCTNSPSGCWCQRARAIIKKCEEA